MITREDAYELLTKYNNSKSLITHGLAVEAVMRYFARKNDENEEYWGIVGLLHDIDYELYPNEHCHKSKEILKNEGVDDSIIHAVISHGWNICTDVEPIHKMEKVLYTIDELTGLITATVFMRPDKSVLSLEPKSVKKKFKSVSFAAGVNRDIISAGCTMLEMDLDTVILWTIEGMKEAATELGLAGI
ncbi:putative nucleotidyltransferase with HDIG domain [Anaerosolibacter carboniphilus]|uniref:Putative nucleotidyltransferase with HDIG domain n=1 Tax=Anaerosolibacter carboniphilus TaxID=1417629 RepID=A0A841L5S7_9FIRM|nr:HDIG domain-containing metalloprotein [Anaerosolibacter carboniphilus]MBB6217769.1 putative nucleotidyltransferase with HDIG domain [Anaerosolibacter carboniphilus]